MSESLNGRDVYIGLFMIASASAIQYTETA